jgi:glycogen debranching enzyme
MEAKGCIAQAWFVAEVLRAWLGMEKKNGRALLIHGCCELTFNLKLQNSTYLAYSHAEILNLYLYSATP